MVSARKRKEGESPPPAISPRGSALRFVYSFEQIDGGLPYMPLAVRRALDLLGAKLTLDGWLSLGLPDRKTLLLAGASDEIDTDVVSSVLARARPTAAAIEPIPEAEALAVPPDVARALGNERPIDVLRWAALRPVDRYVLGKLAGKPEKLARAYDEIVRPEGALAHVTGEGEARMVDVAAKPPTARRAVASARVSMSAQVLDRIVMGSVAKGDVLAAARIAGIQAAKRTAELIPLCHILALTRVEVTFAIDRVGGAILVRATAEAIDRTGVEMEALVAASTAALTVYDMVKSADRWITIDDLRLEEKSGGRSGHLVRPT